MQARDGSISDKAQSPTDTSVSSPQSSSSVLDPSSVAAFTNLLPLGSLALAGSSAAVAHGPISGVHKLPPRPRPGRKADPNPAPTKKGQSNRLAQQKHRQKKKQLEAQEIERQRKQAEENNRLMRQNAMLLHENKRLKQIHVTPGPLSPALASSASPNPMSMSPQPAPSQSTQLRATPAGTNPPESTSIPAPGGCGDCVEGGSCPCVDSLIETGDNDDPMEVDPPAKRKSPRSQRPSLSIQSILSPAFETNTINTASHHEHEIDFTSAFRAYDPTMPTGSLTTCGACPPNDTSCLCRKANMVVGSDADSEVSSAAHSRATSAAANGPGSCARCQADPKQRAWCQGLAAETLGSPITSASDNGDHQHSRNVDAKRNGVQYETISCAEAYSVQKRFADSNKGSRRRPSPPVSAVDVLNSVRERPREYSAFEVDIGTVLSNLKHCSPRRPTNAR